jgi:5'-3' exonuclease
MKHVPPVDHFFIDQNCALHPECAKIKEYYTDISIEKLEKKMFKRVINYLIYLENYVNPGKSMMVSVDGVAPAAKQIQQRKRRYRAKDDTELRDNIKKKYGKPVNNIWHNTVITPSTDFMERLHLELLHHFKNRKSKIKYIYSSVKTVGEGEHGILQYIKKNILHHETVVIYGLDSDLLMLAMASGNDNVYLLRESVQLGIKKEETEMYDPVEDVAQDLTYVSIKELKIALNQSIWEMIDRRSDRIIKLPRTINFTNDFIVICFLLGNDFMPHIQSIDIYNGGLDDILYAYVECLFETNHLLTSIKDGKIIIDHMMFAMLIKKLASYEHYYFTNTLPKSIEADKKKRCFVHNAYEKELWDLENMKNVKIHDPVELGVDSPEEYKFRYYEHYFGVVEHQEKFIEDLVGLYLEGIMWNARYYFEECKDYRWFYPYDHSPFLSDIAHYIIKHKDINLIEFKERPPVTPMVQLISVLPPSCSNLLPKSYRPLVESSDSPIIDMFPKTVELDMLYKNQFWKCIPKLPIMDIDRIIKAVEKKKLTKEEMKRNEICDEFIFGPQLNP